MSVWIDSNRKTVALKFNGVSGETFTVRATREGDKTHAHSSGPHPVDLNDKGEGAVVVTFPNDFTGEVFVEVTGSDGSRAQGTVSVE